MSFVTILFLAISLVQQQGFQPLPEAPAIGAQAPKTDPDSSGVYQIEEGPTQLGSDYIAFDRCSGPSVSASCSSIFLEIVLSFKNLCGALTDDDAGCHRISRSYAWHDRPISDTKIIDSVDF